MKYFISLFFGILVCLSSFAQNAAITCNLGFRFEISNNPNWGENEPVVVEVTPGSPAARAGLKLNDIILEVNGNGTFLKPYSTIMSWFAERSGDMTLSIRNLETTFKTISLLKDCRFKNAINEAQLSSVFAFYSLEDVQDRRFVIPVKTKVNPNAKLHLYRTYDFAENNDELSVLDKRINSIFERILRNRGLRRDTHDPDFVIQTYYSYESNSLFKPNSPTYGSCQNVWRFDTRNNRMIKIPVYSPSEAVRVDDIMFNLSFGFQFYDKKYIEPGEMTLIWESEVKERLSTNYGLENYLEMNLPLILLKYPYPGSLNLATYQVNHLKYNYTGISFDLNDLKTIVAIDAESPAAIAGLRPGDVVLKIQNQKFDHNSKALTQAYRLFIAETMQYRDRNSRYTDVNGFNNCMFWDVSQYHNVANALKDKRYKPAFAYLFNFNQYIDWETPRSITIEVERGDETLLFEVFPKITVNSTISVK
jgi:hypothetical protein